MSSPAQLPPRAVGASHSVLFVPASTEIFFSFPCAKKPIHCPSGEKNGLVAPRSPPAPWTRCHRWLAREVAVGRRSAPRTPRACLQAKQPTRDSRGRRNAGRPAALWLTVRLEATASASDARASRRRHRRLRMRPLPRLPQGGTPRSVSTGRLATQPPPSPAAQRSRTRPPAQDEVVDVPARCLGSFRRHTRSA